MEPIIQRSLRLSLICNELKITTTFSGFLVAEIQKWRNRYFEVILIRTPARSSLQILITPTLWRLLKCCLREMVRFRLDVPFRSRFYENCIAGLNHVHHRNRIFSRIYILFFCKPRRKDHVTRAIDVFKRAASI